ncbi:MAG: acetoacetate decarboxylase family protein [Actinomycetota bacterium]
MGFVKTREELDGYYSLAVRKFFDAEMLGVLFETRPEIVRRLLPPPLEPAEQPGGLVFIADYPRTNLGPGYHEGALFLRCTYQGEAGSYCLSMPIDDEPRMHNGRDIYGFPKKLAQVHMERSGDSVEGWIERNGVRFVEVRAKMTGSLPELPELGPIFLFKAMPRADLEPGFDGPVLLVRQKTDIEMKTLDIGTAELVLLESPTDPWAEIDVTNVIVAYHLVSDNTMQPGNVVAEVDPEGFLPYYFKMTDLHTG